MQLIKQLLQGNQLVKGAQLSQRGEQGQTLRIGAHQAGRCALAVGLQTLLQSPIKLMLSLGLEHDRMEAAQLRWQIQAIAFAAMQQLGPQQTLELIKAAGPLAVPHHARATLTPMPVAKQGFVGLTIPG